MDEKRFDVWARYIGMANSRREALAVLAGGVLASLGFAEADARNRKRAGHGNGKSRGDARQQENGQRQGGHYNNDNARGKSDDAPRKHGHANDAEAAGKKKQKCVKTGGSCKKPKKGKAKKCCAGLTCDGQSRRCIESGGEGGCSAESKPCNGGCIPQDTPCCQAGFRPCDGVCQSGTEACETEFGQCMAPVAGDWFAALDACANECAGDESPACRECLEGVLEDLAEPLMRCLRVTCTDATQEGMAERSDARAAAPKSCDPDGLRVCRLNALLSGAGQTSYAALLGMLEGPIGAAGAMLLGVGLTNADIEACEQQFGCPGGECDSNHGVCCDTWNCKYYDPRTKACTRTCNKDQQCDFVTRTCAKKCKQCYDYLVDGRQMPCGQITNNCGSTLTCNGCASNETCVDRSCKPKVCPSRGRRGRAAGDDCCLPQTCAELGRECGTQADGCGGTVSCGGCSHVGPRGVCLEFEGRCSCTPDDFCHGCGLQDDGCGRTFECYGCVSESIPNGYCGEDRQCHCTPDTCADIGKTCGTWPDGCGDLITCGPADLLCGADQQICCAEGQTCCGVGWYDSTCCDWSACHYWPGGQPKSCCPEIQQCVDQGGNQVCCREGWRCRGAGDPSHSSDNCCILPGQGDAALHIDSSLCCSGELASMYPHLCA
jgi:hypothetical protein